MTDISLMNIGNEVQERKGDFHKIVSLRLKSTFYDALEGRRKTNSNIVIKGAIPCL
ncbi:hypothetical protein F6Y02_42180 (plasmid) [Bacillus megaterium]|nr:hypothetical protein [Priestia megaterium]